MSPILPFGIIVALIAIVTVRHQNLRHKDNKAKASTNDARSFVQPDSNGNSSSALEQARRMEPPAISLMQGGEYEHGEFWGEKDALIKAAWEEWWNQQSSKLPNLMAEEEDVMIDPTLLQAIRRVRQDPTNEKESDLQQLFQPVILGQVYQLPFLTRQGVLLLRQHLDAASYHYNNDRSDGYGNHTVASAVEPAGIPTRRPNGMNRYGIILDDTIEGAVSYYEINTWMQHVVDEFVRPLSRMLFPQLTSRYHPEDDCESYAFTIRYHPEEDMELKEHSDASVYTININLNLISQTIEEEEEGSHHGGNNTEQYSGSSLYFVDPITDSPRYMSFTPGMAVLHRGLTRHAALPITHGERHNLVIWLFGHHGDVRFGEYPESEQLTVAERWSTAEYSKKLAF
jgi:hypothetical protein